MTQKEAIKTVDRIFNYCEEIDCHLPEDEKTGYKMYSDIIAVMDYIRNTPEVVRCKDCKHNVISHGRYCVFGDCSGCLVADDFFCKYGQRRETE